MFGKDKKLLVEILSQSESRKKKCVDKGDYVIIKQGKGVRGDPTIKAYYDKDCLIPFKSGLFRSVKQKLIWKEGHKRCTRFYGKNIDISKPDVSGFFNAGAIKNAGSTLQTIKAPTVLYLLLGFVLIMQVVNMLLMSGRLRL